MIRENEYKASAGLSTLIAMLLALVPLGLGFLNAMRPPRPLLALVSMLLIVVVAVAAAGFFTVNPGEAKVLQLLGVYKGTVRNQGFWYANPFVSKKTISLRIRNFETAKLKVNDNRANPIEIAAIVVWKVVDTAEALFEVDN